MEQVIESIGITAVVAGVLGFVLQSLFKHVLTYDLNSFKVGLDKEMERFKLELKNSNDKEQFKFSKLHEKRLDKINSVYVELVKLQKKIEFIIGFDDFEQNSETRENFSKIKTNLDSFEQHYLENKLFIPKKSCDSIEDIIKQASRANAKNLIGKRRINQKSTKMIDKGFDNQIEAYEIVSSKIPPLIKLLEEDFRRILEENS